MKGVVSCVKQQDWPFGHCWPDRQALDLNLQPKLFNPKPYRYLIKEVLLAVYSDETGNPLVCVSQAGKVLTQHLCREVL